MDKSNTIKLVASEYTSDAYGILQRTDTLRTVYCNVDSVTQREFFEGGRNGLNPEYKFTMFAFDYAGESLLIYNGVLYSIYRTYRTEDDQIELYCERKHGND